MGAKLIDFIKVDQLQHNLLETQFGIQQNNFVYTDLNTIRNASSKFNMPLIPLEYFDMKNALDIAMFQNNLEQQEIKDKIIKFVSYFKDLDANIYVMCPTQFYNIQNHISSNVDKEILFNGDAHFITINAMIPFLRELKHDVTNISNRVETLEKQQKFAQSLTKGFGESRKIQFADPMLFAIPKGQDIYSETNAIIGACWGKDIDSTIIDKLELKNINNGVSVPTINSSMAINIESQKQEWLNHSTSLKKEISVLYHAIEELENVIDWNYANMNSFVLRDRIPHYLHIKQKIRRF